MKRMLPLLLLLCALTLATGCDELEEINVDLGGWLGSAGHGGDYWSTPGCGPCDSGSSYYEEVWIEEEYYVEDYYYDAPWYDDDSSFWF